MTANIAGLTVHKAADVNNYGKFLLHGPNGSGKTYLASTIAKLGKTLMVDLVGEKGTRSFEGASWEKNIDIVTPETVSQFTDLYWFLANPNNHDYVATIVDSLTAFQISAIRFLTGRDETAAEAIAKGSASMRIQDWGDLRDIFADITTFWYGLADGDREQPMHVVMTSQTKLPNPSEEEDAVEKATLALSGGGRSFALSTPDYVLFTDVEPDYSRIDDDGDAPERHLLRIVSQRASTKARIPVRLHGKLPNTLGRGDQDLSLPALGKVLRIGGMTQPEPKPKTTTRRKAPAKTTPKT